MILCHELTRNGAYFIVLTHQFSVRNGGKHETHIRCFDQDTKLALPKYSGTSKVL